MAGIFLLILGPQSQKKYPERLRRVAIWDEENQQTIELMTNQMSWTANTISELYKSRWQIEIFFRDIKQLLHINSFIGASQNGVMIQIWTALYHNSATEILEGTGYVWLAAL